MAYTKPTGDNLPRLFLGTPLLKGKIWELHDGIAGFNTPALLGTAEAQTLPPAENRKTSGSRKVEAEIISDDLEDIDELEDDDNFDSDLEISDE